ncbi:MAG: 4Fe-4S dicluster domain-containing protein [Clostridia bacterium]|nr:4Fe-4S dicluster domain-containing protein [Clostridia bacterium]
MKKIALNDLSGLFERIAGEQSLYLPIEFAGQVDFGLWSKDAKVRLDALKTNKSAKGAFFPQVEDMVRFHTSGKNIEINQAELMDEDFVIFGVRACDAKSFEILDRVFLAAPADPFYAARRAHATVVTLACSEPDETCFCTTFGIDPADPAGDATAWIADGFMYLRANTEKGEALLESLEEGEEAPVASQQEAVRAIMEKLPFAHLNLEGFDGEHLMEKFNSPEWARLSRACLGCGTCTFVCPTCQCYDIRDFDTGNGIQRYRCWDSCMFSDFTLMAHGNNRTTQVERFRQRFMHKLVYFPSNNEGIYSCVGCGRCLAKCPQSLHIVKIIKALGGKNND